MQGAEHPEIEEGIAGDIVAMAKLETRIGNVLSLEGTAGKIDMPKFPHPMFALAIEPKSRGDADKVSGALARFTEEDPCFQADRDAVTSELVIRGVGDLHVRSSLSRMLQYFKLDVNTKPPRIPYRETIMGKIENVDYTHRKQSGGSGQYGNAINAFRAGNVIVRGNRIRNCDYSAVRGNSASNIQISGNSVSDVREVALYSEFSFEGAVIANNTVDGAALGVSVCNFNEGGRLAVVQGNIIRNLLPKRPIGTAPDDDAGIGIYVEADTAVSGNVIENAPAFGIIAGWGKYLRDVAISGNVIRKAFVGIGVSVASGAGSALVNNNMISETPGGAVVGLDHARPVTSDLSAEGAQRFAQVVMGTNAVRR